MYLCLGKYRLNCVDIILCVSPNPPFLEFILTLCSVSALSWISILLVDHLKPILLSVKNSWKAWSIILRYVGFIFGRMCSPIAIGGIISWPRRVKSYCLSAPSINHYASKCSSDCQHVILWIYTFFDSNLIFWTSKWNFNSCTNVILKSRGITSKYCTSLIGKHHTCLMCGMIRTCSVVLFTCVRRHVVRQITKELYQ